MPDHQNNEQSRLKFYRSYILGYYYLNSPAKNPAGPDTGDYGAKAIRGGGHDQPFFRAVRRQPALF